MQISIEHKNMELSDAIRSYVEEKVEMLSKYADIIKADIDLGKTTAHHQNGEIYFCEMHIFIAGKDFFVKREENDLYKAIDKVKDHLKNELTTWKDKHISERRREKQEGEDTEESA